MNLKHLASTANVISNAYYVAKRNLSLMEFENLMDLCNKLKVNVGQIFHSRHSGKHIINHIADESRIEMIKK